MSHPRSYAQLGHRNGGDKRGSAADRRARKIWMLNAWGNGEICPCVHCQAIVSYDTVEADRIEQGGSYRRSNVQPSCRPCNIARSNNAEWAAPLAAAI